MHIRPYCSGFTLLELMLAVFLATLLITATIQLLTANVSSYRLQIEQSHLEESSQYARSVLISHMSQAGHRNQPWDPTSELPAITSDAIDNFSSRGDQLGLQRWSRKNCYGNNNPANDPQGLPAAWLLQSKFKVSPSKNLAMTCRYGPGPGQLVTQMNNFGLVENVESMQVLYAEDTDSNQLADVWVHANQWQSEPDVHAIKVALLLASNPSFGGLTTGSGSEQISLLDEVLVPPSDGRIRKVSHVTSAVQGRLQ